VLDYRIIPVTPFQQNCTLIWCRETGEGAVIDPGGEAERILAVLPELEIRLVRVLLTHGHLDHVGAAADLAGRLGIAIEGPHRDDEFLFRGLATQCEMFGFPPLQPFYPGRWLEAGDLIRLGNQDLSVIHCPGHTPGHIVFFDAEGRLAQVGDVLFRGSIGRTDFPRGSHRDLLRSIRERLFPLGDDVRFIPGHGPMSTFGVERRTNPFVGARQP
jgi:hydroxyacylglutathione hydrolase